MTNPLVSIMIPAYNLPEYTQKTLESILAQDYRPIEIVLSDDASPASLEPMVEQFRRNETAQFKVNFFRQPVNLGGPSNSTFIFDRCRGRYLLHMPHDDWFLDPHFLSEAVGIMQSNPDCHLCVANSEIEGYSGQTMLNFSDQRRYADGQWRVLDGGTYLRLKGADGIGEAALSAILWDLPVARSLGAYEVPFFIPQALERELQIMSDEGFAFQFLLASVGSVAITSKVVSMRGMPATSYSKNPRWTRTGSQSEFVVHYNLWRARLRGPHASVARKRVWDTMFSWPVNAINPRILRHYHYRADVVVLLFLSFCLHWWRVLRNVRTGSGRELFRRLVYGMPVFGKMLLRLRLWSLGRRSRKQFSTSIISEKVP